MSPSNIVEPLSLVEFADRWGLKYSAAADRIYIAANAGQLRVIQRPGKQKYYLSDELEAVFGPPTAPQPDPGNRDNPLARGPVKATYPREFSFEFDERRVA
jgi:hypothetical protein